MTRLHVGRSWSGHRIEDACPCHQAECGLVDSIALHCDEHSAPFERTLRQIHLPADCPGRNDVKSDTP